LPNSAEQRKAACSPLGENGLIFSSLHGVPAANVNRPGLVRLVKNRQKMGEEEGIPVSVPNESLLLLSGIPAVGKSSFGR
jgi:hypothetical protein